MTLLSRAPGVRSLKQARRKLERSGSFSCSSSETPFGRRLQYSGFLQQSTLSESLDAQLRCVDQIRLAVKNEIGNHAAGGRRMHHAVSAKTVHKIKTFDIRSGYNDGVMIG